MWLPKSLVWSDDGLKEERGGSTSSVEYYEHNVDDLAIEVVGQNRTSEVISLFRAGGIKLPLVDGPSCQEMRDVCKVSSEPLDSPRSLCSECQRSSLVDLSRQQSFFLTVDGL